MPEIDEIPEDLCTCHICDCEWDANVEDRPCDCCYDCERENRCVCDEAICDECDEYESECTCEPPEEIRRVRPLARRMHASMPSGVSRHRNKQLFGMQLHSCKCSHILPSICC